ncbi:MAG: stage IV sporulation protein A [Christensenellales bacterium]|jgi:stage IV sporulation protein A
MQAYDLYRDIAERTGGDIYLGVVGPVRTGKSTFIKRAMELLVLPNMIDEHDRERALDELPQSAAGKTIMTTQPRFVPGEAVGVTLGEELAFRVRMVDCVGYLVPGAMGHLEGEAPRMVRTPWFEHDIPFEQAAELGTRKVIEDHATIGLVVTTDGSVAELPRASYVEAEERVVRELKAMGKPFVIALNAQDAASDKTAQLAASLREKYGVPVMPINALEMSLDDLNALLGAVLYEFPLNQVVIDVPTWLTQLPQDHWLFSQLLELVRGSVGEMSRVRDVAQLTERLSAWDQLAAPVNSDIALDVGDAMLRLSLAPHLFYQVLGEQCGCQIADEGQLLSLLKELVAAKDRYDRFAEALNSAQQTGYGVVAPSVSEMTLQTPEITRQGGHFGVRLKASAPSVHMMRVDIQTELNPIVGTEKQSEELVQYMMQEFESNPQDIWSTNIFGKSLHEMVREGLNNKLAMMPEDVRGKMQQTLEKIINEGNGGLICILL